MRLSHQNDSSVVAGSRIWGITPVQGVSEGDIRDRIITDLSASTDAVCVVLASGSSSRADVLRQFADATHSGLSPALDPSLSPNALAVQCAPADHCD